MANYFFFLDETGDHGLKFIDRNFPLFLLCGCLLREDALQQMEARIAEFKLNYFKTTNVILHSREIRKCEGAFQILFDLELKARFYKDLNEILAQGQYGLIGSGVNKEEHVKRYGKGADDPYALSLSFILEKLVLYLNETDETSAVEILVEERGKREDVQLLAHFNSILDQGTYYVTSENFKSRIRRWHFRNKRENVAGLQIADLCAYPLARHAVHPAAPYVPFDIIRSKLCFQIGQLKDGSLGLSP